jgi:hypothetical protein
MNVDQLWHALCKAFRIRDWENLERFLDEFQQRLDAGEAPVISEEVSNSFNHAMASAGVAFVRGQFARTDDWPVVDPGDDSQPDPSAAAESSASEHVRESDTTGKAAPPV